SSMRPLRSGRYGKAAAWMCAWRGGALSVEGGEPEDVERCSGRRSGSRVVPGRAATPTRSDVESRKARSLVKESQSRIWGKPKRGDGAADAFAAAGDWRSVAPTRPAVSVIAMKAAADAPLRS